VSVEVHPVAGPFQSGDSGVDAFVQSSMRRAAEARPPPGGVAPVAALLVVRTAGQWTTLEESSATFSEEPGRLLEQGQAWDFFERCGTHYVHAVQREVSALIFVALHPASAAQRASLEARLVQRAGRSRDDLLTLGVLDTLLEGAPSFLAVRADADEVFDVVEPGLRGPEEGRVGRLVGKALRASFEAERGQVVNVSLRPWSTLSAAAGLSRELSESLDAEPERRERLFEQLKLLEGRALDRETLLARRLPPACREALAQELAPFSWKAYYGCRTAARDVLPASLEELESCRSVLAVLGSERLPEACGHLPGEDGGVADPWKRFDTRYPVVLALGGPRSRPHVEPDAHLFTDEEQFAAALAPVPVGTQTNWRGDAFPRLCVRPAREAFPVSRQGASTEEPAPLPQPWRPRDWDALYLRGTRPALVTPRPADEPWQAPPEEQEEASGPLCIQPGGTEGSAPLCLHKKGEEAVAAEPPSSKASSPGAKPAAAPKEEAPEGEEVPREVVLGVSANLRLDGERKWPWWKGLLYSVFLSWREPSPARPIYRGAYEVRGLKDAGPEELVLTEEAAALARENLAAFYRVCGTHRVSQVLERKGLVYRLSPGSPGALDISVQPYGVSAKSAEAAPFHPAHIPAFFDSRARLLGQLSASSPAIPERLVLEPWSEFLLGMGIVQPHQLVSGERP
jgi:hypothetical protein